ncbi:unnamed protein product [Heterobilharzia americana]|nr:unnamed protein product [Heterobilharzia americana]
MRRRVATRAAFEILKYSDREVDIVSSSDIAQLINTINIDTWKRNQLREVYQMKFNQSDLDAQQFMQLFQTLDVLSPPFHHPLQQLPASRFARMFQRWIISKGFELVSIAVSVLNVIFLCVDISYSLSTGIYPSFTMRFVSWCFVIYYLFEQCSLAWAYGRKTFFSKKSNVFGFSIVIILLIFKLCELGL